MKRLSTLLLVLHSSFLILHSPAAVPLRWTVETSRVQPVVFDAIRGETLALEASFKSYGTDIVMTNETAFLCWQTNGMASAWWITNAVASGSSASVLFTPAMDPGAPVIHCFLGLSTPDSHPLALPTFNYHPPTLSYRAAFTLRFRHGPGADPHELQLPSPTIDCAAVTFLNPESAPFSGSGCDTNAVNALIASATNGLATASITNGLASLSSLASATNAARAAADAAYYPKAEGEAWSSYWSGDDVRVTVTNYESAASLPSLYLEQRTNETALATNLFKTIWREMSHWDKFLGTNWNWSASWNGFSSWGESLQDELAEKADRAWGYYDSHTGAYSPAGYTQISSSNIMIAAGMSYQKTVTTSAEVWVLTANEPYEPTGVSTNAGFQIKDSDGNVQFEIVKGDKVSVAAQAHAASVTNSTLYVVYNLIAETHPTVSVCLDLAAANWKAETDAACPATVVWSGSSGAYVAAITPKSSTTSCFAKASYLADASSYIRSAAPFHVSGVEGKTYDFSDLRGVYSALRDVVQALGGSVTNYPSFTN